MNNNFNIIFAIIFLMCGLNLFSQSGGTIPFSEPPLMPSPTPNIDLRIVNLTSPWNFMDIEWPGYREYDDETDKGYPYPGWRYERQLLLAQVRMLQKRGVNAIRIIAAHPLLLCNNAIKALYKDYSNNFYQIWWSNESGNEGNMNSNYIFNTNSFMQPKLIDNETLWPNDNDMKNNLIYIYSSWEKLLTLLIDMKNNINNPPMKVIISFSLGWSIKGALPRYIDFVYDYDDTGDPIYATQQFNYYYSGSNWMYFKTFYDKCEDKRLILNQNPGVNIENINDLLDYLNVEYVEINNEMDNNVLRYNVNPRLIYRTPWSEEPIEGMYYETNDELGNQTESERLNKRSKEKTRQMMDWANMIIWHEDGEPDYLGISKEKVTYGFTNPETLRLLLLDDVTHDNYLYKTLSWHLYGKLFSIGLGPSVDWLRYSMRYFANPLEYSIILGEIGHTFDYQLSKGDLTPYIPFNLNDTPSNNENIPADNYSGYDMTSNCGHYYLGTWLKEAEGFSLNAHENLWNPTYQWPYTHIPPESLSVAKLKGLGIWSSSDLHLITENASYISRWGLFETFDTPYRKSESWAPDPNVGFRNIARTKKEIIAPIARYALEAVDQNWRQTVNNPIQYWTSGDKFAHPFWITDCETVISFKMDHYTMSYPVENPPTLSCAPQGWNGGADAWFYSQIYYNVHSRIACEWWGWSDNPNANVLLAIFYKLPSETLWTEAACTYNNDYGWAIMEDPQIPSGKDVEILLYFWTSDPSSLCNVILFLSPVSDPKEQ